MRVRMDARVMKLRTPAECAEFEKNALALGRNDLAIDARKRAIELRAEGQGAATRAEQESLEAVYAYEKVLAARNKKTNAGFADLEDDQAARHSRCR
jgi:hypothetical protein